MTCKKIENLLVDYRDDKLGEKDYALVKKHLENCKSCNKILTQFEIVFNMIDQSPEAVPDNEIELGFLEMLENEKLKSHSHTSVFNNKFIKPLLKIAATFLLMFLSYQYGVLENRKSHQEQMAIIEKSNLQIRQLATVSLLENESASRRLQAVNLARELDHPDNAILQALISKMKTDKHVNVRLAAANALANFAKNSFVRQALITTLETEINANMQIELIQILVDIEEKRAIPSMKKLLNNTETPSYVKDQINTEIKKLI